MTHGLVFDIKKFSLHDGPGIRTTVFLKGCGLRCWWCHNPESQRPQPELLLNPERCIACGACAADCPEGAITVTTGSEYIEVMTDRKRCACCGTCVEGCYADARTIVGRAMTVADVLAEILRDQPFYDQSAGGVTVSGGEPLLQPVFLEALLAACQTSGLHTTVDTCGHIPTAALDRVRPYVNLFLYDLKIMDEARHRQYTGATNTLLLHNLRHLAEHGHRIIVRVPIIPGITDDTANLEAIAAFLKPLNTIERIDILAYHRIGGDKYTRLGRTNPMPPTEPPTATSMAAVERILARTQVSVRIGG